MNDSNRPTMPPGLVQPKGKQRREIALWKEAQTAPLDELMMAYTTITSRLVNLVDENKKE